MTPSCHCATGSRLRGTVPGRPEYGARRQGRTSLRCARRAAPAPHTIAAEADRRPREPPRATDLACDGPRPAAVPRSEPAESGLRGDRQALGDAPGGGIAAGHAGRDADTVQIGARDREAVEFAHRRLDL